MTDEKDFETYLYLSNNKFKIFLFDKKNTKNLFQENIIIKNNYDLIDFTELTKFLDKNIYKIEKLIGTFIKNIFLIIDNKDNLIIHLGNKKKIENKINKERLKNILIKLKNLINENYKDQTIMHILLNKQLVYEDNETSLIEIDADIDYQHLEVSFITLSNHLIINLNKILQEYQIKISKFTDGEYVKNFFNDQEIELSLATHKLINGFNDNEVIIVPKSTENKGFFERFFNFFN
tara:strand:- start:770 stop:1474 length:705 start_codon:yes stop_codon:yes gene_type:complete